MHDGNSDVVNNSPAREINYKALREKAISVMTPIRNAAQVNAEHLKNGYDSIEKKVLDYLHPNNMVHVGPLSLLGLISIKTPAITPKMTRYFLHCCTSSLIAFTWTLLTGISSAPVVAISSALLFEPYCETVKKFKTDNPVEFSVLWGASWVGMGALHHFMFKTTLNFTNFFIRMKGDFPVVLCFLGTAAVMSYVMMSPVERIKNYLAKISAEPSEEEKARKGIIIGSNLNGPAAAGTEQRANSQDYTPMNSNAASSSALNVVPPSSGMTDSMSDSAEYTTVICFAEGWLVGQVTPWLNRLKGKNLESADAKKGTEDAAGVARGSCC